MHTIVELVSSVICLLSCYYCYCCRVKSLSSFHLILSSRCKLNQRRNCKEDDLLYQHSGWFLNFANVLYSKYLGGNVCDKDEYCQKFTCVNDYTPCGDRYAHDGQFPKCTPHGHCICVKGTSGQTACVYSGGSCVTAADSCYQDSDCIAQAGGVCDLYNSESCPNQRGRCWYQDCSGKPELRRRSLGIKEAEEIFKSF